MAVTWSTTDKMASMTLSNGNLTVNNTSTSTGGIRAIVGKMTGKWYWEIQPTAQIAYTFPGIAMLWTPLTTAGYTTIDCYEFDCGLAKKKNNNITADYGVTLANNDVFCVALDCDNGRVWFGKNGVWMASGDPANNSNPTFEVGANILYYPYLRQVTVNTAVSTARFAAGSFGYTPPAGFSALSDSSDYSPVYQCIARGYADFFSGSYRIYGVLSEDGAPGARRVQLIDRLTAEIIREQWSSADGSYAFNYLRYQPQGYTVIEYDHGGSPKNAAIADLVTPELMP